MDTQDEIVRLLLMQMRGTRFESQADAIRELGEAGFTPARIAELLGTSRGTVDVTLARAKRAPKKPAKPKKGAKHDRQRRSAAEARQDYCNSPDRS